MSCRFRSFSQRLLSAVALSLSCFGVQAVANAGHPLSVYSPSVYPYNYVDPYEYYVDFADQLFPGGGEAPEKLPARTRHLPTAEALLSTQLLPFNTGYSLAGGYRPIYSGFPQPVGDQTIVTHGGNGYAYHPVYETSALPPPQTVSGRGVVSGGRALVINDPGTAYTSYGAGRSQGYVASYGGGYYGYPDYGTADFQAPVFYGVQSATRATEPFAPAEQPTAQAAPAQAQPHLAPGPGPRPKSLEELPKPKREF